MLPVQKRIQLDLNITAIPQFDFALGYLNMLLKMNAINGKIIKYPG